MLKLVIPIITTSILNANVVSVKNDLYFLNHKLTLEQFKILKITYLYAKKYNLQYTATAIAWQESQFGKWKINLQDPSCGVFHQLLPDLANRYHIKATNWDMSRLCENLQQFDYSFKVFLDTFREKQITCYNTGHKYKASNWKCAVKAYNTYGNTAYYKNIVNKIKALHIWFKEKEINLEPF